MHNDTSFFTRPPVRTGLLWKIPPDVALKMYEKEEKKEQGV